MSLEIKVPPVGESITEVVLSRWVKNDGDTVEMDEVIAELESDKATFELTAEQAGTLKTVAAEGDTLAIGAVVCTIEDGGAAAPKAKDEAPAAEKAVVAEDKQAAPVAEKSGDSYATGTPSPAAGKILAEKGVDAGSVKGSGVDGRITKEDALNAQKEAPKAPAAKPAAPVSAPAVAGARNERREKMSPLRKTVAKRLVAVKNETAML
ncbi:MAG: E3 binding domain-containing protein, partial [Pedobacter sp.]|nr:E3 binding domain-containing protein [Pedobacter sp.]